MNDDHLRLAVRYLLIGVAFGFVVGLSAGAWLVANGSPVGAFLVALAAGVMAVYATTWNWRP